MTNEELVALIQAGERDRMNELWQNVERFVWQQAGRRILRGADGVTVEDLYQSGYRKVGAHRKANHPTGLSPAGVEYRKVYNRLKARKQRGKISRDEWNTALSQAQEVLDLAEQGKLSDEEMRKRFAAF